MPWIEQREMACDIHTTVASRPSVDSAGTGRRVPKRVPWTLPNSCLRQFSYSTSTTSYIMEADINKAVGISRGKLRESYLHMYKNHAHRLIQEGTTQLEVLLCKRELNRCAGVIDTGLLEGLCDGARAAEVGRDLGLELRIAAGNVLPGLNGLFQLAVDVGPVGAAEHGARAEERERVVVRAGVVDGDVPQHVFVDLLRQVNVDAEEVGYIWVETRR
jgi:hypothetical protein